MKKISCYLIIIVTLISWRSMAKLSADVDVSPFFDFMSSDDLSKTDLLILGETHGHKEMIELMPHLIASIHEADPNYNCFFVELEKSSQSAVSDMSLPVDQVMTNGIQAMFDHWDLGDKFDSAKAIKNMAEHHTLSPELLQTLRDKGIRIIAVDEQTQADFADNLYFHYKTMYRLRKSQVLEILEKQGLAKFLSDKPMTSFVQRGILGRNEIMADNTVASLSGDECTKGFVSIGRAHASNFQKKYSRYYENGEPDMRELIEAEGLTVTSLDFYTSQSNNGFDEVINGAKSGDLFFRVHHKGNSRIGWKEGNDIDATLIMRKID